MERKAPPSREEFPFLPNKKVVAGFRKPLKRPAMIWAWCKERGITLTLSTRLVLQCLAQYHVVVSSTGDGVTRNANFGKIAIAASGDTLAETTEKSLGAVMNERMRREAYAEAQDNGVLERTGEVVKNSRGKPTPVYWLVPIRDYQPKQKEVAQKQSQLSKSNDDGESISAEDMERILAHRRQRRQG